MGAHCTRPHSQPDRHTDTYKMAWHKGTWWPLAVKEWYGPKASQHMFDPYSLCLLVLGLVFHLLWGTDDIDNWVYGFLLAVGLELVWEIIGNSKFVLKRIRDNSGTSGEYIGDSIQNILGDLVSCALGYILGTVFAAVDVLKHHKEELLNWLPPSPLLNFYLPLLTNQLTSQFNGQSLTSLVN